MIAPSDSSSYTPSPILDPIINIGKYTAQYRGDKLIIFYIRRYNINYEDESELCVMFYFILHLKIRVTAGSVENLNSS